MRKMTTLATGIAVTALIATGCSSASTTDTATETATSTASMTATQPIESTGIFSDSGPDFTYDEVVVPVGSNITVQVSAEGGATTVDLAVEGLEPNRDFGAHAHVRECGAEASDSGPHYQNEQDPAATAETPSNDPAYANAQNELWLDFTTDDSGTANASSTVNWEFRAGDARSIVIHDRPTSTDPGTAGTAGDRLACNPVEF